MDPTLAALIGAGIGMTGTVVAPLLSSRRAHAARRREVKREVYAEGMRGVSDFLRVRDPEGYTKIRERLFEAQIQIRLVGSRGTSIKFDKIVDLMNQILTIALAEVAKFIPLSNPVRRAEEAFPEELRDQMGKAHNEFILAARRDIGMEDPALVRAWRWGRRKIKRT